LTVWREAALRDGTTVSEFVRRAVEDRIQGRTTKAIAKAVVTELLPELQSLLQVKSSLPASSLPGATPQMPVTFVPQGPQPFDSHCYSADLHRNGVACNECGGNFVARP
jgi:hypothetical protein